MDLTRDPQALARRACLFAHIYNTYIEFQEMLANSSTFAYAEQFYDTYSTTRGVVLK